MMVINGVINKIFAHAIPTPEHCKTIKQFSPKVLAMLEAIGESVSPVITDLVPITQLKNLKVRAMLEAIGKPASPAISNCHPTLTSELPCNDGGNRRGCRPRHH